MNNIKISDVGRRSKMFTVKTNQGWSVNLYLIEGKANNYIIDTGCGSNDGRFLREYHERNYGNKAIIVINTHFHFDHVWGNCAFEDCDIISHFLCEKFMSETHRDALNEFGELISGAAPLVTPNILFDKKLELKKDGLVLFHSRGHSHDGLCVYDSKDKALYVGDNIGDTLETPIPELMESRDIYRKALNDMRFYNFELLLSGHNVVTNKAFLDIISAALDKMKNRI